MPMLRPMGGRYLSTCNHVGPKVKFAKTAHRV